MTPILDRIRAKGGDVVRQEWRFSLRRGRLPQDAINWLFARWPEVCREVWPVFDQWEERAAIMEYDGGLGRDEAERAAYGEVVAC